MLKTKKTALLALILLTSITVAKADESQMVCKRAIDNRSNSTWEFTFSKIAGSLWIAGQNYRCKFGCKVIIPAHQSKSISYYSSEYDGSLRGFSYGEVSMKDKNGTAKSFTYRGYHFQCPYIEHDGRTGSVSMNQYEYGDYMIEGDTW